MNEQYYSFYDVDEQISQAIYKSFYNGCVVNRKEYIEAKADWVESTLYLQLRQHEKHYKLLYRHLGYELEHDETGEFISAKLLSESESEDTPFDETSLKIVAVLSLISKVLTDRGQSMAYLAEPVQGITFDDLSSLFNNELHEAILKSLKFKTATDPMDFLIKRGFAYSVSKNRYVLSQGAMSMLDTLKEREKLKNADTVA
jgi:hypothetical protein